MKKIKYFRDLVLTWLTSILALAISTGVLSLIIEKGSLENSLSMVLAFFCISFICSIPAFVFFFIGGMIVLKQNLPKRKTKLRLILINYTDILLTGLVMLTLLSPGKLSGKDFVVFIPVVVLIISSTVIILLLPFNNANKISQS